jgi:hypothetical protein
VDRPRLLPRQVETPDQPQHAGLAVALAEAALDQPAEIPHPPGDAAVAIELGASKDQRLEGSLLPLVERTRAAGAAPVAQAVDALGVVAVDPIAERLAGHAGEPRRLLAAGALEGVRQRQQPGAGPTVALAPGQDAQLLWPPLVADQGR